MGAAKNADVTAREAEVLALIARHFTNAQIAETLFISPRTVETHVSALLRKLGLPDRRSLARHAEAIPGLLVTTGRPGLPAPVTSFVGRQAELEALVAALREHRMVTATGPGGVGKTRLALNVAESTAAGYRDGAWFVDLVHVTDPALVTAAVAQTVGVPEQGTGSIEQALVAALAGRDALVVLDNCEHVLDGVRDCVERVLAGCPDIRVLATSRTRLLGPYEWVYAVPGLSDVDGVALFAARSGAAAEADARRVTALCEALDGIALAIELAAARYATLGLDGLEAGLDERLRFLTGRARPGDRHRSLRDAIAWSYDLLVPEHRSLLCAVAVFASWFDVEAAHVVTGTGRADVADGLARLAEHSLLVAEPGTPTRYRVLETIRQYGAEQLELAGELGRIRGRHEQWCRGIVAELRSSEPDDAWCARFDTVVDDIGAALVWSISGDGRADELAAELGGLLFLRGRPAQAQRRYEQSAGLAGSPVERLRYLRLAAGAAASRFVGTDILRLLRSAADLAIQAGVGPGAARDLATMAMYIARSPGIMSEPHPPDEAVALLDEARRLSDGSPGAEAGCATAEAFVDAVLDPGRVEPARRAVALAEQAGDGIAHSAALDLLCSELLAVRDIPGAVEVVRRRAEVMRPLGVSAITGYEAVDVRLMASDVYLAAGDLAGAGDSADLLARLPFYRDEPHLAIARRIKVDALSGGFDDVVRNGERFRAGWQRAGRPLARDLGAAAHAVAMVHGMLGDDDRRAAWLGITVGVGVAADRLAGCVTGWAPVFDALLALHRDEPGAALDRLSADLDDGTVWRHWGSGLWRPWYAALWAEAAVLAGHRDAEVRLDRSRPAARDNPIAAAVVERAAAVAAGDHDRLVRFAITFAQLGCPYQQARTGRLAAR